AEAVMVAGRYDLRRYPGKITITATIFRAQHQGHQCRPGGNDLQPELPRQVVTKRCGSDFGNREPSGCNHQGLRAELCGLCPHHKLMRMLDLANSAVEKYLHSCLPAFGFQHVGNIVGHAVAEKLAKSLL